jgi:hypothetical protein
MKVRRGKADVKKQLLKFQVGTGKTDGPCCSARPADGVIFPPIIASVFSPRRTLSSARKIFYVRMIFIFILSLNLRSSFFIFRMISWQVLHKPCNPLILLCKS